VGFHYWISGVQLEYAGGWRVTYYINVYQIPNDGRRWFGKAVESETLSDELGVNGNRLYRLRVKLKEIKE
jgi:hypothetical protein